MSVYFGKPGTRRYRGKMRAQMQQAIVKLRALLNYNTKLSQRVPPVQFMTPAEAVATAGQVLTIQGWLDTKN